ncbi:Serine/threonine-protein kinase UCNL [Capsicum annuum]|uniref:serine/threonine-protein kinase UCNL n=1 Tax=Capsicum annuum TaxID=4072 RepID=UPI001FB16D61|nr:serine/threonine-protein kinase UCNL [Capsicum annuum]KAF3654965.1 Serine/threonine-protein kinase UCNL [Capsicum annuum]KAF3677723.1 Serine/threonine-protein kinase UCNL [Capsicum annuum]
MDNLKSHPPPLALDNLRVIKVLGKGAMGTVFLVYDTSHDPSALSPFAVKAVDKSIFPSSKPDADRRARWEASVLSSFRHPFLPTLLGFSETSDILCYAVPYCPGGDLNVLRYSQSDHVFPHSVIRFYLAEIVLALEHLHSLGIAYRDLKPENILIQQSGHVTLTDFDLSRSLTPKKNLNSLEFYSDPENDDNLPPPPTQSKRFKQFAKLILPKRKYTSATITRNGPRKVKSARVSPVSRRNPGSFYELSNSFVGTEEYVAPEIVRGEGHEFSVDWWALGVLCYEMLYGATPFKGKNRKETFRRILMMEPEFIGKKNALTDLIGKLLDKDPTRRLGYRRGASEIKEHEFFQGLRWDLLTEIVRPPFLPLKEVTELTEEVKKCGIKITEYVQKLKAPPSPLWSPSHDEWRRNVSFTEF